MLTYVSARIKTDLDDTRRAYAGALRRLDTWLGGRELDDARLAAYLAELFDSGRGAAARQARRRSGSGRPGHRAGSGCWPASGAARPTGAGGQAQPCTAANLAAIFATAGRPRRARRSTGVIAGLLFMAGLRRSEAAALEWRDVTDARGDDGLLVAVPV